MVSDRLRRRVEEALDEADAALGARDWAVVLERAQFALTLEPTNGDAVGLQEAAQRALEAKPAPALPEPSRSVEQPSSFVAGRYVVSRFLGEGGKKKVYLAHDRVLDRDVAFALIKTEGLDDVGRERVTREAQAMGRMGAHPHIVSVFDLGDEGGAPYIVTELMGGGDVEGELERAGGPLDLARALDVAKGVAHGLVYAHERGIVHRDLKPGNVWLTAEGVAKIGDFGLAVAEGRSRLTQHGMMVGTFAYMPPEQALGSEVTPRSDLYSLGAMLYELVTGKPPFEADDPTAVISQHLNAEPVAPSWRTERCPPALEDLILALLAKDPSTRPASAADVLTLLESIDPEAPTRSHSSDSANPLERLARGVFVGRERELERLRGALDDALAGHGSVVMLVGEPGIGKTRTVAELETYARMRGAQVLWGRAHESSGAPSYSPWVQIGRAWARQNHVPALLRGSLSARQLEELSRFLPELPGLLGLPAPAVEAPADEGAQFRLFDTYVDFLRVAEADAPLVLALDDLQWADQPTLQLLCHVARELPNIRLLLLGTYRDTELARSHPLSEMLADLNRQEGFLRVTLRGLSREEASTYIEAAAGVQPAPVLIDRVYAATEGNPFFLSEVVNLLAEEGKLTGHSASDIAIPLGVRDALGRRLDRLSGEANRLLSYAAVVGREFSYDTLASLSQHDEDMLLGLIEEGLNARVIEEAEQTGRYRFTHALMQETVLAELSTTRRARMHGEVGETLEQRLGLRAADRMPELALHFMQSAELNADHAGKAVHYLALAARQAEARFAWGESARLYQAATALMSEANDLSIDEDTAALYAGLARSAEGIGDLRTSWRALMNAAEQYRARDDAVGLAEAVLLPGVWSWGPSHRVAALLLEAIHLLGDARPDLRARIAIIINDPEILPFAPDAEAERLLAEARAIIEPTGAPELLGVLARAEGLGAIQRGDTERGIAIMKRSGDMRSVFMMEGDTAGTERVFRQFHDARETPQNLRNTYGLVLALIALLHADFEGLDVALAEQSGSPTSSPYQGWLHAHRHLLAGDIDAAVHSLPVVNVAASHPALVAQIESQAVDVLWEAGLHEQAAEAYSRYLDAMVEAGHRSLRAGAAFLARDLRSDLRPSALGAAAAYLAGANEREALRVILKSQPGWTRAPFGAAPHCAQRIYGDWGMGLDMLEDADRLYKDALAWCERERCPIEAGKCHQGLAEVAESRSDHALAMQHLDSAGELFARYGAKLYLDQVLAKKEILKA